MSEALLIALACTGLLVGATGTWSPCGFSMIETIGPTGHTGGMRTTLSACATFAPFAVLGGAITFGLLALLGEAVGGAGGTVAYVAAAVVAVGAAVAEARGTPIVPQVRRQLPISWRRTMPMPLAAAGYGVLLGLGFTTFVLSYGVWALMGVCLALGDPTAGLVVGIAFGVGRALPIVVLAPLADRRSGERACEAMAMRPGLLRGARAGDAVALLAVSALLIGSAASASAARKEASPGSDPSVSGSAVVYEGKRGQALLQTPSGRVDLNGSEAAVGGSLVAVVRGGDVVLLELDGLEQAASFPAAGVDALAVGNRWVVTRGREGKRDVLRAHSLGGAETPSVGASFVVATAKSPAQLSRPAVEGDTVVWALGKSSQNSLFRATLTPGGARGKHRMISSKSVGITGPSISGDKVAYVATTRKGQSIRVRGLGGRGLGNAVYRQGDAPPTLWTTALTPDRVYVTRVARGGRGVLVSVNR